MLLKRRSTCIVIPTIWNIWKERKGKVFENKFKATEENLDHLGQEAKQWALASGGSSSLPVGAICFCFLCF
jgi:hypothetical protein